MKTIWKYQLEIVDRQEIQMPALSNILDVQIQNGKPCLWVQLDSNATKENVSILIFGTGHPLPANPMHYIGTFQYGALVFHAYKLITE